MHHVDYLLVGGGIAGSEGAKMIRQLDEKGSILLVCGEAELPYRRPPLTKDYLTARAGDEDLQLESAAAWEAMGVQVLRNVRARALDTERKAVDLDSGKTYTFEKALLATGGEAVRLACPGCTREGVHYLRTVDDARALRAAVASATPVVVVGAGFVGMETAATLSGLGRQVTVVDTAPQVWPRFMPPDLASFFQSYAEARGVRFRLGTSVQALRGPAERVAEVHLQNGDVLPAGVVCAGIGMRPLTALGEAAGLASGNGIHVNKHQQTSHPDVYAAGDVCNYPDPVFGRRRRVEHWGHAEYTGQLAGANMAGAEMSYDLLTYVWSDFFDLRLEFAGDETAVDEVLYRGPPSPRGFTALYLKEGRLRAYLAVNQDPGEFPALQRLIRACAPLTAGRRELEDPAYSL